MSFGRIVLCTFSFLIFFFFSHCSLYNTIQEHDQYLSLDLTIFEQGYIGAFCYIHIFLFAVILTILPI